LRSALAVLSTALPLCLGTAVPAIAATDLPAALIERADRLRGRLPVIVRLRSERPDPAAAAATRDRLAARMAGAVPIDASLRAAPERVTALVDGERLRALAADPDVLEIVPNTAFALPWAEASPSAPSPLPGAPAEAGRGALVAIVDTGVDASHPALSGRVVEEFCTSYASARDADGRPLQPITALCPGGAESVEGPGSAVPCDLPRCEHGTHVAGIAAGAGLPETGGRPIGWAPAAEIVAVQVFSRVDDPVLCVGAAPCVLAFRSAILDALDRLAELARERPIAAVNLSLGDLGAHGTGFRLPCEGEFPDVSEAVARLEAAGTAVVAASGNDGLTGRIAWPACIGKAVAVAAADGPLAQVAPFADFGPTVDLVAPGTAILSAVPGPTLATMDGTSMAAPAVAGAIARLVAAGEAPDGPAAARMLARAGAARPFGRPIVVTYTRPSLTPPVLAELLAATPVAATAPAVAATAPAVAAATPAVAAVVTAAPAAAAPGETRALILSYPKGETPVAAEVEAALARALGLVVGKELVVRSAPGGLVVEASRPLEPARVEEALRGPLAPRSIAAQIGAKPLPGGKP
jgi:subtilisin family serine protease